MVVVDKPCDLAIHAWDETTRILSICALASAQLAWDLVGTLYRRRVCMMYWPYRSLHVQKQQDPCQHVRMPEFHLVSIMSSIHEINEQGDFTWSTGWLRGQRRRAGSRWRPPPCSRSSCLEFGQSRKQNNHTVSWREERPIQQGPRGNLASITEQRDICRERASAYSLRRSGGSPGGGEGRARWCRCSGGTRGRRRRRRWSCRPSLPAIPALCLVSKRL